jgi:hypothetical protein
MANSQGAKKGKSYIPFSGDIKVASVQMASQDISKWKQAIDAARNPLNPRRKQLYELYSNIIIDGRLESVIDKRIMAITNKRIMFVPKDKGAEVSDVIKDQVLNATWFVDFL